MKEQVRHLRPWNVKVGDVVRVPAFPFEEHRPGCGCKDVTVGGTGTDRNFMTGERLWILADSNGRTIGGYYRDERVKVMPR